MLTKRFLIVIGSLTAVLLELLLIGFSLRLNDSSTHPNIQSDTLFEQLSQTLQEKHDLNKDDTSLE